MSLRAMYWRGDWLRGSEVTLGVELVLGIRALWRDLPQVVPAGWGEWCLKLPSCTDKADRLQGCLFAVVRCCHYSDDITHLMSDPAVIKTSRLMAFAVACLVQPLSLLSGSAHPFHSGTNSTWPVTGFAFCACDLNLLFCESSSQTPVCSVSKVGWNVVCSLRQDLWRVVMSVPKVNDQLL